MKKGFLTPPVIFILVIITIAVAGSIYFHSKLLVKNEPVQTETSPVPSPSSDETVYTEESRSANWKTYKSSDLSFSVKYPGDWKLQNNETGPNTKLSVDFKSPDYLAPFNPYEGDIGKGYLVSISVNTTSNDKEYETFLNIPDFDKKPGGNILLDGRNSIKGTLLNSLGGLKGSYIFIPYEKNDINSITISLLTFGDNQEILNQILSTFQFID